jgi:inosose dehydratase
MGTIVQTIDETRHLLENTYPEYVSLCIDTVHFTFSNENPIEAAKMIGERIGHIYLKDIRKEKMQEAMEEGYGFRNAILE